MKRIIKKYTEISLIIRIIIGLIIGVILSLLVPGATVIGILGDVFIGSLKAIAPLLVAMLVCSSIAKTGKGIGSRFRTVIILYMLTTLIASTFAVFAARLFPLQLELTVAASNVTPPSDLTSIFFNLFTSIVQNPIKAIAEANYLSILFWAVVFGFSLKLASAKSAIDVISSMANALSKVVSWIIQFAPFGIMGIMYTNVSTNGLVVFADYWKLILLLVGTMLFTSLVINPFLIAILLKKNPYPLVFECLKTSGIPAFFTRSSAANIPVNMSLCEKLGIDKDFYSISIPLGATINMDGAASVITIMSLTAANTLGINVPLSLAIVLSIISTLAACGASGVAGGSLLLIPMACSLLGIGQDVAMQVVAVGFVIGVVQDSFETALNSSGDVIFTVTAELYDKLRKDRKTK